MNLQSKLLALFFLLFCSHSQAGNLEDDIVTRQLFMKAELKAIKFRKKTYPLRFVDPIEMNDVFYNIVKRESPALYSDTPKYTLGLLNILKDKSIKSDEATNQDVFRILDNLCIDDYVEVIDSVYSFYKQKQVTFSDLEFALFQDFNISNQVAKNYKNETLQTLLKHMLQELQTGKFLIETSQLGLKEEIEELLLGKLWENDLKETAKIQPPLLKQENCK